MSPIIELVEARGQSRRPWARLLILAAAVAMAGLIMWSVLPLIGLGTMLWWREGLLTNLAHRTSMDARLLDAGRMAIAAGICFIAPFLWRFRLRRWLRVMTLILGISALTNVGCFVYGKVMGIGPDGRPERILPIDPHGKDWFTYDGKPRLWVAMGPNGEMEFFDVEIKCHPRTRETAMPVSQRIYRAWREKEEELHQLRSREQELKDEAERLVRLVREKTAALETERRRLDEAEQRRASEERRRQEEELKRTREAVEQTIPPSQSSRASAWPAPPPPFQPLVRSYALLPGRWLRFQPKHRNSLIIWADQPIQIGTPPVPPMRLAVGDNIKFLNSGQQGILAKSDTGGGRIWIREED